MDAALRESDDGSLLRAHMESGSQEAVAILLERHLRAVRATCLRIIGDGAAADDAAQETFIVMVRKARSLTAEPSLGRWLYYTARHRALRLRRARARRRKHEAIAERQRPPGSGEAERDPEWEATLPLLDEALSALPGTQRDAIVLRYFRGLSLADCAAEAGCPLRTLQTRLARGLERLRERLLSRGAAISQTGLALLLDQPAPAPPPALAKSIALAAAKTKMAIAATGVIAWSAGGALAAGLALTSVVVAARHPSAPRSIAAAPSVATADATRAPPRLEATRSLTKAGELPAATGIWSVAFSPDGRSLVGAGFDGDAVVWDIGSRTVARTLRGHTGRLLHAAWSPDGALIATAGMDRTVKLWNAADGSLIRTLVGHSDPVWAVAFSPDGRTLASGGADYRILLWPTDHEAPPRELGRHGNELRDLVFTPDGATLISGGNDYLVRWWDVAGGREIDQRRHPHTVRALALSRDGRALAVHDGTPAVRVYDANRAVIATGPGGAPGTGDPARVAMAPDGELALSGGEDGVLILWSVADGRERARLALTSGIIALACSPDGRTVAVGHGEGAVDLITVDAAR